MFDVVQVRSGARVVTDFTRDARLTVFGKATLTDRYLLPGENYQDMFARVASAYADDTAHAQRLYDYISKLWFMPATPVLSNGGTKRGLPISCFLNEANDSLDGILGPVERECLAGGARRRHRLLLGQSALDRREGRHERQDLRHRALHPGHGFADPRDQPGLAAPRIGRGLSAGQPSRDRGIHRDAPPDRRRPQPQGAQSASRHADLRRLHARGRE